MTKVKPVYPGLSAIQQATANRVTAEELGYHTYQGNVCARGHVGTRYVKTNACVECAKEDRRARTLASGDEERERRRKWKADNRDKVREEKRRYAERHRESIRAATRARYAKGAPLREAMAAIDKAIAAYDKAKRKTDKLHAEMRNRHRAIMLASQTESPTTPPSVTPFKAKKANIHGRVRAGIPAYENPMMSYELEDLHKGQGGRCAYCGSSHSLTVDHKIALSKGGLHVIDNLQWLCHRCNTVKGKWSDSEYRLICGIPDGTPWDSL